MRVTAGLYRGRPLQDVKFEHIRPTADMVKQALFNKLAERLPDSRVLDLFCGSGALGIEAVSRGAKEVIFADKDERSVALTKTNLKNLGINAKVIKASYDRTLAMLKGKKFDIILLDPPYKSEFYLPALDLIYQYELLDEDGIIVCEHEKTYLLPQSQFNAIDEKRYGIKQLTYLSY